MVLVDCRRESHGLHTEDDAAADAERGRPTANVQAAGVAPLRAELSARSTSDEQVRGVRGQDRK